MYWPHTRDEDEDRVWGEDGTEDVTDRPASYQIMACRIRGGRFSDPFVVADLPCDTDVLTVLNTSRGAALEMLRTEFVYTQNGDGGAKYVDSEGSPVYNASHIWYTSVPDVLCATAVGCEATNPFVNPGGQTTFHVAVRNDGNTFLSGCTLTLCVYDEELDGFVRVDGSSAAIYFNADTLQESNWNPRDEDGNLQNVEPADDNGNLPLCPGKTAVYAVTVAIPEDWSGEKKVLFVASDGVESTDDEGSAALSASAEGVSKVSFAIEPGEHRALQSRTSPDDDLQSMSQRHMDTLVVETADASQTFSAAPVTVSETLESGSGGQSGGASSTSGGTTTTGTSGRTQPTASTKLPDTGDHSPSGLLSAGLAAAGAAALAYERRRARNER